MDIYFDNIYLDKDFPLAVGRSKYSPFYTMGEDYHWHDCYEMSLSLNGNCVYDFGDRKYKLTPGEFVIINNTEPHRMYTENSDYTQLLLIFHPSILHFEKEQSLNSGYLKLFKERNENFSNKISPTSEVSEEIIQLLTEIENEYAQRHDGWKLMIVARLLTLLTLLYRNNSNSTPIKDEKKAAKLRLLPVLKTIEKNYCKALSSRGMADIIHVSNVYFSTIFKAAMNKTFTEYLNEKRIRVACELLLTSDLQISSISEQCGFSNLSYFNRSFKTLTGLTPKDYRKSKYSKNYTE